MKYLSILISLAHVKTFTTLDLYKSPKRDTYKRQQYGLVKYFSHGYFQVCCFTGRSSATRRFSTKFASLSYRNLTGVFLPLSGRDAKIFRLQGILAHKLNKNNVPDAFTPYQYMHSDHSNTSQLARLVLAQGTSLLLRHFGLFTN